MDEGSRKLIDNAVSQDDILNLNVTGKSACEWKRGTRVRQSDPADMNGFRKTLSRSSTGGRGALKWMRCISYRQWVTLLIV